MSSPVKKKSVATKRKPMFDSDSDSDVEEVVKKPAKSAKTKKTEKKPKVRFDSIKFQI